MYLSTPLMVETSSGIAHGQRKWSGMDQATKATGKQTSTAKHGGRATALWLVWHHHYRAATSCSNPPVAVLAPTSSCVLRTPQHHTPKNKSRSSSFFFSFWAPVKHSFISLITRLVKMWCSMNWPYGSSPGRDALRLLFLPTTNAKETEGCWSFFSGALAHIFSKGWNVRGEAKRVLKLYPFFFILYITCLTFVIFFFFWMLSVFYLLNCL